VDERLTLNLCYAWMCPEAHSNIFTSTILYVVIFLNMYDSSAYLYILERMKLELMNPEGSKMRSIQDTARRTRSNRAHLKDTIQPLLIGEPLVSFLDQPLSYAEHKTCPHRQQALDGVQARTRGQPTQPRSR
jgi:hypothetical protein